jgi:hypothetical protein
MIVNPVGLVAVAILSPWMQEPPPVPKVDVVKPVEAVKVFQLRHGIQGSGKVITETRKIEKFDSVDVGHMFQVEIKVGPKASLKVEADDNLMPLIVTEVNRSGEFTAYLKQGVSKAKKMRLILTTPTLNSVQIGGASSLDVVGLKNKMFDLECGGATGIKLAGEVDQLSIEADGACSADLTRLIARSAFVETSGAASVMVKVLMELRVDASGASSVTYYGSTRSVKAEATGFSTIKKAK